MKRQSIKWQKIPANNQQRLNFQNTSTADTTQQKQQNNPTEK